MRSVSTNKKRYVEISTGLWVMAHKPWGMTQIRWGTRNGNMFLISKTESMLWISIFVSGLRPKGRLAKYLWVLLPFHSPLTWLSKRKTFCNLCIIQVARSEFLLRSVSKVMHCITSFFKYNNIRTVIYSCKIFTAAKCVSTLNIDICNVFTFALPIKY